MTGRSQKQEQHLAPASVATMALLTIFVFSTPAKWATLHISSVLILLTLLLARRDFWVSLPVRAYVGLTLLWLLPVTGATALQHLQHLETATSWSEQAIFILRVLGVSLGVLFLLQKQWITLRQLTFVIVGSLLVHGLIGIGQWILHPDFSLTAWRSIRIQGIVGNPNPYGLFMALGLVLSAALLRDRGTSQMQRLALWIAASIFALGILSSGSRGAIITAATGIAVLFPPNTTRRIGLYSAILGSLAFAYFVSNWQDANAHSDDTRAAALKFSLQSIAQRPLAGWGFQSFMRIPGHSGINAAHNMLADLALSSGVIALGTFLLSITWVGYRLLRMNTPLTQTLLALLACAFVAGTLEYSILSSNHFRGPWMLLVALACQALGAARNCNEQDTTAVSHRKGVVAS
ncbi:O-antigen ligase family protein [Thauera sp. WH-2]|jgi:O-antigen ligase|uniref:O-antigen ligase family protein n=1 Tax=Thauera sp. WH-2 TaxID=3401574 RepID=UPI003AB05A7F